MEPVRLNRDLVKIVYKYCDLEAYRLYVIARLGYSSRSGIFSLDELCDLLHQGYGRASLHRRPGNGRRRYQDRLAELLGGSLLFTALQDGRYRANSERAVVARFQKGTRHGYYTLPDASILASKRQFFDFCVGMLLSGNRFRANKNISKYCGCTVRRVQYATSRNHREELFRKQYNFIEDFSGTYEEVLQFRAMLFNVHGISSPLPVKRSGEWVLRLNAPNSYTASVLSGVKGDRAYKARQAQPTVRPGRKEERWFIPIREKKAGQMKLFKDPARDKRWFFNTKVYTADRYIQDHSRFLA